MYGLALKSSQLRCGSLRFLRGLTRIGRIGGNDLNSPAVLASAGYLPENQCLRGKSSTAGKP